MNKLPNEQLELLSAYLDSELGPEEIARAEELIRSEPLAREFVDQFRRIREVLKRLPILEPPDDLSEAITAQIRTGNVPSQITGLPAVFPDALVGAPHAVAKSGQSSAFREESTGDEASSEGSGKVTSEPIFAAKSDPTQKASETFEQERRLWPRNFRDVGKRLLRPRTLLWPAVVVTVAILLTYLPAILPPDERLESYSPQRRHDIVAFRGPTESTQQAAVLNSELGHAVVAESARIGGLVPALSDDMGYAGTLADRLSPGLEAKPPISEAIAAEVSAQQQARRAAGTAAPSAKEGLPERTLRLWCRVAPELVRDQWLHTLAARHGLWVQREAQMEEQLKGAGALAADSGAVAASGGGEPAREALDGASRDRADSFIQCNVRGTEAQIAAFLAELPQDPRELFITKIDASPPGEKAPLVEQAFRLQQSQLAVGSRRSMSPLSSAPGWLTTRSAEGESVGDAPTIPPAPRPPLAHPPMVARWNLKTAPPEASAYPSALREESTRGPGASEKQAAALGGSGMGQAQNGPGVAGTPAAPSSETSSRGEPADESGQEIWNLELILSPSHDTGTLSIAEHPEESIAEHPEDTDETEARD